MKLILFIVCGVIIANAIIAVISYGGSFIAGYGLHGVLYTPGQTLIGAAFGFYGWSMYKVHY